MQALCESLFTGKQLGKNLPVLDKNYVVKLLPKQVQMAYNKDVMSHHCHNRRRAACHPVNSKSLEIVEAATVQQRMCERKPKAYCNDKKSDRLLSVVGIAKVYSEKTANKMQCGAFVMYALHACC